MYLLGFWKSSFKASCITLWKSPYQSYGVLFDLDKHLITVQFKNPRVEKGHQLDQLIVKLITKGIQIYQEKGVKFQFVVTENFYTT